MDTTWTHRFEIMRIEAEAVGIDKKEIQRHMLLRLSGIVNQMEGHERLGDIVAPFFARMSQETIEGLLAQGESDLENTAPAGFLEDAIRETVEHNLVCPIISKASPDSDMTSQIADMSLEIIMSIIMDEDFEITTEELAVILLRPMVGLSSTVMLPDRTYRFANGMEIRNLKIMDNPIPSPKESRGDA